MTPISRKDEFLATLGTRAPQSTRSDPQLPLHILRLSSGSDPASAKVAT